MDPLLAGWLTELRGSAISLDAELGSGALENLWTIAIPKDHATIGEDELMEFLREAQRVRLSQATKLRLDPVVFYVWHDEMAGQLRFSVARGTAEELPFGARVERVADLRQIVRSYLHSEFRHGIPWDQLAEAELDESEGGLEEHVVRVWAVAIT